VYAREDFLAEIFFVPVRDLAIADNGEVRTSYAARCAAKLARASTSQYLTKARMRADGWPEGIAAEDEYGDEYGQYAGVSALPKRAGIIWRLMTNSKMTCTD
jgi:hypothetical protein